jgi:hypothetical protein
MFFAFTNPISHRVIDVLYISPPVTPEFSAVQSDEPGPPPGPPDLVLYNEAGTVRYDTVIDFGTVAEGGTVDIVVRLVNEGEQTLDISQFSLGTGDFSVLVPPLVTVLQPGEFTFATLRFAPEPFIFFSI